MVDPAIPSSLHWRELHLAKTNQARCREDVEAIKKVCAAEHPSVRHVSSCPTCFPKVTERMLRRFQGEDHDQEWFAHRRAFLVVMESQLAQVREGTLDLQSVERSVDHEKEAWYRGLLRRHSDFICATGDGVPAEELKEALEDTDRSRDDLVDMVWRSIGSPADWEARIDSFLAKWAVAVSGGGGPAAQKALYTETFFQDAATGATLEGAETYRKEYEAQEGNDLQPVIEKIMAARREEKASEGKRGVHQGRLDELRRARTAFEELKAATKAQQRAAQASAVGDQLYDLPACAVCSGEVQPKDVLSCPVCQVVGQTGGAAGLTVYCSEACRDQGQEEHVEKEHDCVAGEACAGPAEEDVDAEADGDDIDVDGPVLCRACLEEKRATIFCTPQCASANITSHREATHGVKSEETGDKTDDVTPLSKVVEDVFHEINPGLKYTWS